MDNILKEFEVLQNLISSKLPEFRNHLGEEIYQEKKRNEALKIKNETLVSKNRDLKQKNKSLQNDNETLHQKLEAIKEDYKKIKKELAKLQEKVKHKENLEQKRDIFKMKRKSNDTSNGSIKNISPPFFDSSFNSKKDASKVDYESPIKRLKVNNKQNESPKHKPSIFNTSPKKPKIDDERAQRIINVFDLLLKGRPAKPESTPKKKITEEKNDSLDFERTFDKHPRRFLNPNRRRHNNFDDFNFVSDPEIDFPTVADETKIDENPLAESPVKIKEEPKTQNVEDLNQNLNNCSEELFSSPHFTDSVVIIENSQKPVQTFTISDSEFENTEELEKQVMKAIPSSMPKKQPSREVYEGECKECKQYLDERAEEIGIEKVNMEFGKCKSYCSGYVARVAAIRKKPNFKPQYQTMQANARVRRAEKEEKEERYTPDGYWDLQVSPVRNQHLKVKK